MSMWNMMNFMDGNSPSTHHLVKFHDHALLISMLILILVAGIMISVALNPFSNFLPSEMHTLEFLWTVLPIGVLITIAIPSLIILFLMDEKPNFGSKISTTKITGYQWYWEYESDFMKSNGNKPFNLISSYMIPSYSLSGGGFRLLETTGFLPLFSMMPCRLLITSSDVLHSWAMPAMGVKMDACPGRLNEVIIYPQRTGVFYGQCSEICGSNHSFMPSEAKVMDWMSMI